MEVKANAKINLGLNVTGIRQDGYHNIETVFYPIRSVYDRLVVECNGSDDIELREEGDWVIAGEKERNLIVRVFRLFQTRYDIGGVNVLCEKNIPYGAGLGGGSADAAFTAIALNRLFELRLTSQQLQQLVAPLGADCAFFILNTPCFAEGVGDILSTIDLSLSGYQILLVKPADAVSTQEAYDKVNVQIPAVSLRELVKQPVAQWRNSVVNDFEVSVFPQHPAIAAIKEKMYDMGALYASLSGSGSTVYGLFPKTNNLPDMRSVFPDCWVSLER